VAARTSAASDPGPDIYCVFPITFSDFSAKQHTAQVRMCLRLPTLREARMMGLTDFCSRPEGFSSAFTTARSFRGAPL